MQTKPTKYFLYVRKSTDEVKRQVLSLPSQVSELREFAKREGFVIHEKIEESQTAKAPGRPLFNSMLDRIEQGEANGILCWDIDRLYRNPVDDGRTRWMLQQGVITSIRTPRREYLPSDAGLLMAVEGGRATEHIMSHARNLKRTHEEKLRRGQWPGGPKTIGYVRDDRSNNIAPHPVKAKVVHDLFEEFGEGRLGLLASGSWLAERGITTKEGTPFSKSQVRRILSNKMYIGMMVWKGEVYEGKYKPIVSTDLFKKVQRVLKVRSKPRKFRKGHQFPFCGIFRCSCGSMLTAQWTHGHGGTYRYYRCTRKSGVCDEPYLQEAKLAQQCIDQLRSLAITKEEASELHAELDRMGKDDCADIGTALQKLSARLLPIEEKLRKLTRALLDEVVDEDSYQVAKEELIEEKLRLKEENRRIQRTGTASWIEPARKIILALETLGKMETQNDFQELGKLVQKIGTNPLFSRKIVTFSLSPDYAFIPSLLASARVSHTELPASRSDEISESSKWCA